MNTWKTLGELVRSSAIAHANRPALWVDERLYTYGDLIQQAFGIANAVAGTRPRTAIFADRRFWSYAGIIGTVLAGHAYVPLNPRHPQDRLNIILRSADVGALILDSDALSHCRSLIETMPALRIVVPDAIRLPDWTVALTQHTFVSGRDLCHDSYHPSSVSQGAYLLFTSGSTGTPKGVMVSHDNVISYLNTVLKRYTLTPEDRVTQLFDLTFDLSVHDMFVCWAAGSTLYCPADLARKGPRKFIQQHALTCWFSTPATVSFMSRLRMLRPDSFETLRWSLFCGEPLPKRLAQEWRTAAPNSLIENLYGPTEATIAITAFRLPTDWTDLPDILPIGSPFFGQHAMVRGVDGYPVSIGQDGELWLSGSQVTDGYWQQPELTTERFVTKGDRRWYRTGDRVIFGANGLYFRGRMDRQVKISGHRVELLEVETALRLAAQCDTVAAVVWPVDADGLAQGIVGFVADESRTSEQIFTDCRKRLPPYMMPSRVMRVTDWPLNTNGKTDYRALVETLRVET